VLETEKKKGCAGKPSGMGWVKSLSNKKKRRGLKRVTTPTKRKVSPHFEKDLKCAREVLDFRGEGRG